MKTYTFTLPKNNDSAKEYKNKLIERMITAYPWLTIDSKFDYPYSDIGIEHANAGDYITFGVSKSHNVSWFPGDCNECSKCCADCLFKNAINYDLEKEFLPAMDALKEFAYANYPFKKDYDFETEYGVPVKFFSNFVQIGYDIIPFELGTIKYIKPNVKKIIIDIVIKIKNNTL